jgi:DNA-binding response OmpR family regulator
MTILVVDDQENMCWILSKLLTDAGFSVETANTAKEALAIATKVEISAAIIDYRLPDDNGFNLFLNLRKQNNIPCVLITSYGSAELREKALSFGFDDYFDKPFDNNTLIAAVRKILARE